MFKNLKESQRIPKLDGDDLAYSNIHVYLERDRDNIREIIRCYSRQILWEVSISFQRIPSVIHNIANFLRSEQANIPGPPPELPKKIPEL